MENGRVFKTTFHNVQVLTGGVLCHYPRDTNFDMGLKSHHMLAWDVKSVFCKILQQWNHCWSWLLQSTPQIAAKNASSLSLRDREVHTQQSKCHLPFQKNTVDPPVCQYRVIITWQRTAARLVPCCDHGQKENPTTQASGIILATGHDNLSHKRGQLHPYYHIDTQPLDQQHMHNEEGAYSR